MGYEGRSCNWDQEGSVFRRGLPCGVERAVFFCCLGLLVRDVLSSLRVGCSKGGGHLFFFFLFPFSCFPLGLFCILCICFIAPFCKCLNMSCLFTYKKKCTIS